MKHVEGVYLVCFCLLGFLDVLWSICGADPIGVLDFTFFAGLDTDFGAVGRVFEGVGFPVDFALLKYF